MTIRTSDSAVHHGAAPLGEDYGLGGMFWQIREAAVVCETTMGRIVLWNPAAELLFGYTAGEARHMTADMLVPPGQRERVLAGLARYAAGDHGHPLDPGKAIELPARHRNGEALTLEVTLSPIRGAGQAGVYVLAIVRDATDRGRAEVERERRIIEQVTRQAAESAQQRFALLAEASARLGAALNPEDALDGMVRLLVPNVADWCRIHLLDYCGDIQPIAFAHIDEAAQALIGRLALEYPVERRGVHPVATVLRTGRSEFHPTVTNPALLTVPNVAAHRELVRRIGVASYMCVPLMARGKTLGALALGRSHAGKTFGADDLTLVEDLATRIAMAVDSGRLVRLAQDAMLVREEFLASASHDLRTPVTMIKAFAQMLEKRASRSGTVQSADMIEGLESIDDSATRLAGQIKQLLDGARVQSGRLLELERRVTDLLTLVRGQAATHEHLSGRHSIHVRATGGSLCGLWDALRLDSVVSNLLGNAVKFSPPGIIDVQLHREESPEGDTVVLTIADRGSGIPSAELEHVGERFFRASNVVGRVPGTGMGLFSAGEIIRRHGGTLSIDSRLGQGTTVTVRLPIE